MLLSNVLKSDGAIDVFLLFLPRDGRIKKAGGRNGDSVKLVGFAKD